MGAFADFLKQNNLKTEQLVLASARLENLQEEDEALVAKRAEKRAKQADTTYEKAGIAKPRTGRAVSALAVQKALDDKVVPRRVRAKLLRAVNHLLKGKGEPVDARKLFGSVGVKYGKKKRPTKK